MSFLKRIHEVLPEKRAINESLFDALKQGNTCTSTGDQFPKYEELENAIVESLLGLLTRKAVPHSPPTNSTLTEEQKKVVDALFKTQTVLLSGGPGTGKTFTIAEAVKELSHAGIIKNALIAAPTGKAASILADAIGKKAPENLLITTGTLHSVLSVGSSHQMYNTPLYLGADLIVVDECSMLDITMWYALCKAVSPHAKLLLVGDVKQLPPVDAGSLFFEVESIIHHMYPEQVVFLTTCLRSESKEILALAQNITEGKSEESIELLKNGGAVSFCDQISFPHPPSSTIPEELLAHFSTFRFLCARKEGKHSVASINAECRYRFHRGSIWAEPILIARNASRKGLYNGDNGIIIRHRDDPSQDRAYFQIGNGVVSFSPFMLPRYELAYAISIHKSQGSEYDAVTIVLPEGAEVFGKELLYTAVTRAKHKVELFGAESTVQKCIRASGRRMSGIYQKALQRVGPS